MYKLLFRALLLTFVVALSQMSAGTAKAQSFTYSNFDDVIAMGATGSRYNAVSGFAGPAAKGYFCELFGFFNCLVQPAGNTWIRARIECWDSSFTSGVYKYSDWVQGVGQQAISPSCSGAQPNPLNPRVQVASTFYTSFSYP